MNYGTFMMYELNSCPLCKALRPSTVSTLIINSPCKERWGLLADRYGLPIRGYWQTVWSANKRLLADRVQNI